MLTIISYCLFFFFFYSLLIYFFSIKKYNKLIKQ